jgi:hypothetical protein
VVVVGDGGRRRHGPRHVNRPATDDEYKLTISRATSVTLYFLKKKSTPSSSSRVADAGKRAADAAAEMPRAPNVREVISSEHKCDKYVSEELLTKRVQRPFDIRTNVLH